VGRLDKALDEANARGWTIVDMKRDWSVIFPPDKSSETPGQKSTHLDEPRPFGSGADVTGNEEP
jgi:hypothetical protein